MPLRILLGALAGLAVHLGLSLTAAAIFLIPFGFNSQIYHAGAFGWILPGAPGVALAGAFLASRSDAPAPGWRSFLRAAAFAFANVLFLAPAVLLLMVGPHPARLRLVGTYFVAGVLTGYLLTLPLGWAVALPLLLQWAQRSANAWRALALVAATCLAASSPFLLWPVRREGVFANLKVNRALIGGKREAALAAIRAGEPVGVMDRGGSYAIISASEQGYPEVVRELLSRGARVAVTNSNGIGPVQLAAQRGHVEVLGVLLDAGADVNEGAAKGHPALAFAAGGDQPEAVRFLLKRGARTDVKGATGSELLRKAWDLRQDGVVAALREARVPGVSEADLQGREMLEALRAGRIREALDLVQAGADPDARDVRGSALLSAIVGHQKELAEALLARGANPNSNDLESPLVWAIREEPALVAPLLARGASLTGPGKAPLILAAELGDLQVVKLLLEAGADAAMKDAHGRTALDAARDRPEIREMLQRAALRPAAPR